MDNSTFREILHQSAQRHYGVISDFSNSNIWHLASRITPEEFSYWEYAIGDKATEDELAINPAAQYDAFLYAFVHSDLMKGIPWSQNVEFREFWTDKKGREPEFSVNFANKLEKNRREFYFSANSVIDGIRGQTPLKSNPWWHFVLDASLVLIPDAPAFMNPITVMGSLYVVYRNPTMPRLILPSHSIHDCRLALMMFLETAWKV